MTGLSKNQIKIIQEPIANNLIKNKKIGGKQLSYISGSTVIDMLNRVFNYMWSWEIEKVWIEECKDAGQGQFVAHVLGKLIVYMDTEDNKKIPIVKMATGNQILNGRATMQESVFKAAGTDALKKAASLLGIGLSLWRDEEEEMYIANARLDDEFNKEWNKENIEKYKEELSKLSKFKKELGLGGITNSLREFSGNKLYDLRQVVPSNIKEFIEFVDKKNKTAIVEE